MEETNHLVIFTPHALTVDNGVPPSSRDISEAFAQALASKAQSELKLASVATKSVGGKDLNATFENLQRALGVAECAIIVIPGSKICLLDAIYPRLLVFLTMHPEWLKKMLLVGLGDIATNGKKFDHSVFEHAPVIFSTSAEDWPSETDKWQEVFDFIHRK